MVEERLRFLVDGDWARSLRALTRLKCRLDDVDFEATSRLPYPGRPADLLLDPANLGVWLTRGSNQFHRSALASAFRRWMARSKPQAVALHELLTLGQSIDRKHADVALGDDLLDDLIEANVLEAVDGSVRANVLAVARSGLLYLSDPARLQDHPDYVYAGRSSFSASDYLSKVGWRPPSQKRGRLLDLGCGAGFAAVAAAASGVERVVGSDIVERCLYFCRLNAALNGLENVEFVRSDVFSAISGDFDVIVSNAPCIWEVVRQATFATGGAAFGTELPSE